MTLKAWTGAGRVLVGMIENGKAKVLGDGATFEEAFRNAGLLKEEKTAYDSMLYCGGCEGNSPGSTYCKTCDKDIHPSQIKAAPEKKSSEKKSYTIDDLDEFFADWTKLRLPKNTKEQTIFSNELSQAQEEALHFLTEELAEAIYIIQKMLRHGPQSCHPEDPNLTNTQLLSMELGHVQAAVGLVAKHKLCSHEQMGIRWYEKKVEMKENKNGWFHHQKT